MDKAREKTIEELAELLCEALTEGDKGYEPYSSFDEDMKDYYRQEAEGLLDLLSKKGYRKLPKDKPPLLSDEEFMDCAKNIPINTDVEKAAEPWIFGARLIEAQREADIKHYEH